MIIIAPGDWYNKDPLQFNQEENNPFKINHITHGLYHHDNPWEEGHYGADHYKDCWEPLNLNVWPTYLISFK